MKEERAGFCGGGRQIKNDMKRRALQKGTNQVFLSRSRGWLGVRHRENFDDVTTEKTAGGWRGYGWEVVDRDPEI
jgi:hypothetical protein